MGNSEVGHLNVGAGRVGNRIILKNLTEVYQDIVRIELSIENNSIAKDKTLLSAFERTNKGNGRFHLLGLVSDGGVHAHINHLIKLLDCAKANNIKETFIHCFGDGRDVAPKSICNYIETLQAHIQKIGYGKIATVTGRYYAMDRDKRWERVKLAYEGLCQGLGEVSNNLIETIQQRYAAGETDEFLKPIICEKDGSIQDNDTLLFFNFRSDRMRELTQALGIAPLPFETTVEPKNIVIKSHYHLSSRTSQRLLLTKEIFLSMSFTHHKQ